MDDPYLIIKAHRAVIVAALVASLRETYVASRITRGAHRDLLSRRLRDTREELKKLQSEGWISDPRILAHAETVLLDASDLCLKAIENTPLDC